MKDRESSCCFLSFAHSVEPAKLFLCLVIFHGSVEFAFETENIVGEKTISEKHHDGGVGTLSIIYIVLHKQAKEGLLL